jgi:hypothetical protein
VRPNYVFKTLCWRGVGEMAYLTEHLSRQERNIVHTKTNVGVEAELPVIALARRKLATNTAILILPVV